MSDQGFHVGMQEADFSDTLSRLLSQSSVQSLLILLAACLAYANTLDVPFYLDDFSSIRNNPAVQGVDLGELWNFSAARFVAYLSFSVNHALHGFAPAGYHLLNILVHGLASLCVYQLARGVLATPRVAPHASEPARLWLPLLAALIFALHPLQTQAVTYIIQRIASLAALFYLLSLALYIHARLCDEGRRRLLLFGGAAVAALLAFFTKQNTFTLPLAIVLIEVAFFGLRLKKVLIAGAAGGVALVILLVAGNLVTGGELGQALSRATMETDNVGRLEYLAVQMQALWLYLLKFVLPFGLHLEYDLAVPAPLFNFKTLIFALGHAALLGGAVALLRRSPVIAFAILFYYVAHAVESSIIPIRDFAFEHRTYLPNAGLCLLTGWVALSILPRHLPRGALAPASAVVLALLLGLTLARNGDWRDPIAFFEREVALSSTSFRAGSMLGEAYSRAGRQEEALAAYLEAQSLFATRVDRSNSTETAYFANFINVLQINGRHAEARALIDRLMQAGPSTAFQSTMLMQRANMLAKEGSLDEAETLFLEAIALDGRNLDARSNYAKLLLLTGRALESQRLFQEVYAMDPANSDALMGLEYFRENPPATR